MNRSNAAMWVARGACVVAGLVIAAVPTIDGFAGVYRVLALVPFLFTGVLVGLYFATSHGARLERSALVGAGIGVLVMLVPAIFLVGSGSSVVAFFIIGVPAAVGFTVFVLFMAYLLWSASGIRVPRWVPVSLVVVPVLDPLLNGVLIGLLPVGVSATGLAWVATGVTLRTVESGDGVNSMS
jgi:hypothetical protein